jgi:ubiquinone/menaquinone biosynthesis C-methylase UbiE
MSKEDFIKQLKKIYDESGNKWSLDDINHVVGSFDEHNKWKDYKEYLFKGINTTNMIALDFGTGVGRNIVLFKDRFIRIDGADFSKIVLEKAKIWLEHNNIPIPNLYETDGKSLSNVPSNIYDMVFSTICLQHISVYSVRYTILEDMFRVLKNGGYMCHQMGYGKGYISYYENEEAMWTDVSIENAEELEADLKNIGFINFSYDLRHTGPGDVKDNWIFFRVQKP